VGHFARIAAAEVKDYRASIEKLRRDAAEAALIRDLATDRAKRDLYDNLHKHFNRLADEVEHAVKSSPA
jgi:DNA-binding transcriptional regulator YbjK